MPSRTNSSARRLKSLGEPETPESQARSAPFRRDAQHQAKIDAIVAAAARLIHERGVAGASLDDVAIALGVTKPSIYYYVKSKEDLVFLCHLRISQHQARALDKALAQQGSGADKIETFIRTYAAFVWAPDSGLPRLWQDNSLSPARRRAANKSYFEQSGRLVALIAEAVEDGSIEPHDPEIVERALVSSILWVPIWYNEKNARYDEAALLTSLLAIFFNGLKPPAGRSPKARRSPRA